MASKIPAIENKLLAIACVLAAVSFASTQDALVKLVSGFYPVHEALFFRCLAAQPILLYLVLRDGGRARLMTAHWPRIALRGAILCSAYLAFVLSIAAVPIANSVAIYFTMPLFAAALAGPMLGERVPPHRWIAILVGFCGVILAQPPERGLLQPAALLALWAAVGYAIGQLMGRRLSIHVQPTVMSFHQNLVYLAVALALAAVFSSIDVGAGADKSFDFLSRGWIRPSPDHLALLLGLGILAAFGMVLFSTAYKYAPASFVAPFEYSTIFWALGFGIILWGDAPDGRVVIGAAIVMAAGLFMMWRDHALTRAVQTG